MDLTSSCGTRTEGVKAFASTEDKEVEVDLAS